MRAGQLRRRLSLMRRTPGQDSEGSPTDVWVSVGSVWAAVEPLGVRELMIAAQAGVEVTHQITLRYRADIDHNSRLVEGTRTLDVQTVVDLQERHRELQLFCLEVIPT